MLRAAATELLLGQNWIWQGLLACPFRGCKLAPLVDPGLNILMSAPGLFLRKGCNVHDLYPESPSAVNRQTHEVRIYCTRGHLPLKKKSLHELCQDVEQSNRESMQLKIVFSITWCLLYLLIYQRPLIVWMRIEFYIYCECVTPWRG